MSKRLQVVVDDAELRKFQRAAKRMGLTLAEWSRQALRRAERASSSVEPSRKLEAVRAASKHSFPAPEIETMLGEIEKGYDQQPGR